MIKTIPPVCLICVSTRGCLLCADSRRAAVKIDEAMQRRWPGLGQNPPESMITSDMSTITHGEITI